MVLDLPRNSCQFLHHGSKYFRTSSRKLFGFGTNLQNQNDALKKIYFADKGKVLSQRDQSGAEALIVAYLCRNGNYKSLFLNKIKPHVFVALHLFPEVWRDEISKEGLDIKCDIDELLLTTIPELNKNPWWKNIDFIIKDSDKWESDKRYYYMAKQVCHASNYGQSHFMLSLNTLEKSGGKIVIQAKEAKRFIDIYHSLFPEIQEDFQSYVKFQGTECGVLYNLLGQPIQITSERTHDRANYKEWYSAIPQSTVTTITKMAIIKMQSFIDDTKVDWDILNECHDSFLVQSPENEWEQCQKVMKEFIEPKLTNFKGEEFQMKSEGATGKCWAKYSKDNIDGLKGVEI